MQPGDLPAAPLGGLAVAAEVELAVQPRRRLVGDQPERRGLVRLLGRWQPGRIPGAVVVAEAGDGLREDLDPAARRRQRAVLGIGAEDAQDGAVCGLGRQFKFAAIPALLGARWVE